ncbi:C4-type zinc ribbon domain-containing protein [Pelagicoccus sp. SDUM812003]|nr:C4-type zinc ribbon domain-containing protein [Pelagicoccus sp. SDUM812003]
MLILQDRDMKLQQVEDALKNLPVEQRDCQARIETLKAAIEAGRQRIRELETKGKSIETEMASVETQIVKYKNQQLQVKKNEEYQALTHEIETAGRKISDLESEELEVLYELDEARKTHAEEEKRLLGQIEMEQRELAVLREKEERVKGERAAAVSAREAADAELDNPTRSKYLQVARGLAFPIVVEMSAHKCGGCHMRVSNAIDSDVRAAREITTCDNCGRILYSAS